MSLDQAGIKQFSVLRPFPQFQVQGQHLSPGLQLDAASLKGLAIWISAAREYSEGRNSDAVNAFSGWYCLAFHNHVLAERLGTEG